MHKFTEIIGQDHIREHLQGALKNGKVSHAYILDGPRGSGKRFIADIFASALLCASRTHDDEDLPEPCGECISCIQAENGSNPDIIHVMHAKPKTVSIEEIRAMRDDVRIKPFSAEYKVYILDDAQMMPPGAQNALLKTLEEPPAYAVLFLLADGTQNFLPTVLSRCVTLRMRPVPGAEIRTWLENVRNIPRDRAAAVSELSGGSIGQAVKLAESDTFEEERSSMVRLMTELSDYDCHRIAETASALTGTADRELKASELIRLWIRDLMVVKATGSTERIAFSDQADIIADAAARISDEGMEKTAGALDLYDRRIKANIKEETALELLLLTVRDQLRPSDHRRQV